MRDPAQIDRRNVTQSPGIGVTAKPRSIRALHGRTGG